MESETTHLHTNGELHSEHTDSDDDADNNLTTSTPTRNYHRAVRRTPAVFNNLLLSNGDMSGKHIVQVMDSYNKFKQAKPHVAVSERRYLHTRVLGAGAIKRKNSSSSTRTQDSCNTNLQLASLLFTTRCPALASNRLIPLHDCHSMK